MNADLPQNRQQTFLRLLAVLLMFLAACSAPDRPEPTAPAAPSPAATGIRPSPTRTSAPTPTEALPPLERSLQALESAASVRIRLASYAGPDRERAALVYTADLRFAPGPPEQAQTRVDWGDGLAADWVCLGGTQDRQCWSKVGRHPWTLRPDLAADSWTEQRRQELAATTVISTTVLSESNQVVVAWSQVPLPGADPAAALESGQTWLQADTYLPVREVVTGFSSAEQPVYYLEAVYTDYNAPFSVQAPAAATVTPVPTAPAATLAPGVARPARVKDLPLAGAMWIPAGPGPFPAVIVLHGSEGGVSYTRGLAQLLAQQGFAALALCYFGCPQTPATLQNIPVETVIQAVDYLRSRPDVRPEAVGLLGLSRGAELALIVGALDPEVRAVIAVMGFPWVVVGLPSGTAWLYQDQPLPFRGIPVEQIDGPVLVLHGERDDVWPVDSAYLIADRLAAHKRPVELAVYADRGHNLGHTPPDAFNRMVDFLNRSLL